MSFFVCCVFTIISAIIDIILGFRYSNCTMCTAKVIKIVMFHVTTFICNKILTGPQQRH